MCEAGTIDGDSNSATACTVCGAGSFTSGQTSLTRNKCTPCAGGEYQDADGATACKACAAGSYCPPGAAAALPCEGGSYSSTTDGYAVGITLLVCLTARTARPPTTAASSAAPSPRPRP